MKDKNFIKSFDSVNLSEEAKNRIYKNIINSKNKKITPKKLSNLYVKYACATVCILLIFGITTFSNKSLSLISDFFNFNTTYDNNIKNVISEISDGTYTLKITECFQTISEVFLYVTIESSENIDLHRNKLKVYTNERVSIPCYIENYTTKDKNSNNYIVNFQYNLNFIDSLYLSFIGNEELKLKLKLDTINFKRISLDSYINYKNIKIKQILISENTLFLDIITSNFLTRAELENLYKEIFNNKINISTKTNENLKITNNKYMAGVLKNSTSNTYTFKYSLEDVVNLDDIISITIEKDTYYFE